MKHLSLWASLYFCHSLYCNFLLIQIYNRIFSSYSFVFFMCKVIWTLQPSSQELEVDIIKEALKLQDDSKGLPSGPNSSTSTSISVSDRFN